MAEPADAPGPADGPARRSQPSPLERIASFRFAYLAIFVFLLAYVFTVEGLQEVLRRHYRTSVAEAVRVDPARGSVARQIQARLTTLMKESPWIRYGDVRVRPLVLGADGRTLLYAGGTFVPSSDGTRDAELLPAIIDVEVVVQHNTVLSNVVLVGYAGLLITVLALYTRRLAGREVERLAELALARDALAARTTSIEGELGAVRSRLEEVEPENEIQAEEIDSLQRERGELQRRLAGLEQREAALRSGSARAQKLDEERRALEDLLEEASQELSSKDQELTELRSQSRRAGRRAAKDEEQVARRLRTLYKNLEVDDRAIRNLADLGDEAKRLRAEEAIKRLSDEPETATVRRKVGGLPPHLSIFELGFADKGRIYYTGGKGRRFRVLAIGAKNSQKTDLEYLSRLPRGT
jgi:predicted  nucleic acid-binding Zn-ribbon protein